MFVVIVDVSVDIDAYCVGGDDVGMCVDVVGVGNVCVAAVVVDSIVVVVVCSIDILYMYGVWFVVVVYDGDVAIIVSVDVVVSVVGVGGVHWWCGC